MSGRPTINSIFYILNENPCWMLTKGKTTQKKKRKKYIIITGVN